MSTNLKISIEKSRDDDSLKQNFKHIRFEGKSINYIIINTLRRIILNHIPTYAFEYKNIDINQNTSVYNNNYMKNRIEMFPIPNIENNLDFENFDELNKYIRNIKSYKVEEKDIEEDENILTMYVKKDNKTNEILNITTDDCEFYQGNKKINTIYKNALLVCKLKPKEVLEFSAKSGLGVALNHACYSCVSACCYEMETDHNFLFKIEAISQLNEIDILIRSCDIINYILTNLKNKLLENKNLDDKKGYIILENHDHTIGNLISRELQDHKDIKFAAYKIDHLLIRNVSIYYEVNDTNIYKILEDCFKKILKQFIEIKKNISILKK
tara:strand:- start:3590 stop:4567 length:978 start_codon:yes stop_codon:yes gene_type:complete